MGRDENYTGEEKLASTKEGGREGGNEDVPKQ